MGTLIFIVTAFSTLYLSVAIVYYFVRKNKPAFTKTLKKLFWLIFLYLSVLITVSLLSKSSSLPLNSDKCFDDWCVTVIKIDKVLSEKFVNYLVTLRISNHGRGKPQRPDNPQIYVIDEYGHKYYESDAEKIEYEKQFGVQKNYDDTIPPQSSFETKLIFKIPSHVKRFLVITEGGFPVPLIIGDEGSLLHKKSSTILE